MQESLNVLLYAFYCSWSSYIISMNNQKANKTVPTDQQGHFGWIKKDSTDMYKHWE